VSRLSHIIDMSTLRVVQFTDPLEFVASTIQYDDYNMNFVLGTLLDFKNEARVDSQNVPMLTLLAVYRKEELLCALPSSSY